MEATSGHRCARFLQRGRHRAPWRRPPCADRLIKKSATEGGLDWLKKKLSSRLSSAANGSIQNIRSCRYGSSANYWSCPFQLLFQGRPESATNLTYMRLMDQEYTRHPFYGVPRMTVWLRQQGLLVGLVAARRRRNAGRNSAEMSRMYGVYREGAKVLDSFIHALSWNETLKRITVWAKARESRYVCICNVHSVVTATRDAEFKQVLKHADLEASLTSFCTQSLPDGNN